VPHTPRSDGLCDARSTESKDAVLSHRHCGALGAFVIRCNAEDLAKFEHGLRAWGRGSKYVDLTDEQYERLRRG
jgi:hypothetical protein